MARSKGSDAGGAGIAAWLTLLQARSVVVEGIEQDLERKGRLPLPWFEVLLQVTSAPEGRLKMQELAHSVLLSKSGVTRLVDRMVEAGLMTREACATDRRSIYAVATPAGRAALKEAMPVHEESLERRFSAILTPAELSMLRTTLKKILDASGFAPAACPSNLDHLALDAEQPRARARR